MRPALRLIATAPLLATLATPAGAQEPVIVAFDEAHFNVHSLQTPYRALGDLATELGYLAIRHAGPFTQVSLLGSQVLVACCARAREVGPLALRGNTAHLEEELEHVERWVREGGALLLVMDHYPIGGANRAMAARFGVDVADAYTDDGPLFVSEITPRGALVFDRTAGRIADHPITCGRTIAERVDRVATYDGTSLSAPPGSVPLLLFTDQAVELVGPLTAPRAEPTVRAQLVEDLKSPTGEQIVRSAAGRNQGVALTHGRGRVVILGEAAMLYNLEDPTVQNRQFATNLLRWLAGDLDGGTAGCGAVQHMHP